MGYAPRGEHSNIIGGTFVERDGTEQTIPDHFITNVTINKAGSELKIHYSHCTVRISGSELKNIRDDARTGKLGTVDLNKTASSPQITMISITKEDW